MKYIFDSSILMRSIRNDFDKDEFADFLEWIFGLIESGIISIPNIVYNELLNGDDVLAKLAKEFVKDFKIDDSLAAPYVQKVIESYDVKETKDLIKINNDAFIIAHALACEGTVVTYEKESNATSAKHKKIPSKYMQKTWNSVHNSTGLYVETQNRRLTKNAK